MVKFGNMEIAKENFMCNKTYKIWDVNLIT